MLKEDYNGHELYYDEQEHIFRCDELKLKAERISKLRKKIDTRIIKQYNPVPAYTEHGEDFIRVEVLHPRDGAPGFFVCKIPSGGELNFKKNRLIAENTSNQSTIQLIKDTWKQREALVNEVNRLKALLQPFDPETMMEIKEG